MQLLVNTQELHTLKVMGQGTVTQIKAHAFWRASLDQAVLLVGTSLEDDAALGQCGMEALTTLEVAGHKCGGKVHDFLAHAGKVRCKTPKVAKQEKKKKTGQVKQKMQYNQHFVNVVPRFNKKGPSANS